MSSTRKRAGRVAQPEDVAEWRVPDWHGDEWQKLDAPISQYDFGSFVGEHDDEHADEGTLCEGFVLLVDGSVGPFSVEKSYMTYYSFDLDFEVLAVPATKEGDAS